MIDEVKEMLSGIANELDDAIDEAQTRGKHGSDLKIALSCLICRVEIARDRIRTSTEHQ